MKDCNTCPLHGNELSIRPRTRHLPIRRGNGLPQRARQPCRLCRTFQRRAGHPHFAVGTRAASDVDVLSRPLQSPQLDGLQASASLSLQLQGNDLVAGDGQLILQGLSGHASSSSKDGLLLVGLTAPGATSMFDTSLGKLHCRRFLACARCKLWWMTPEWGSLPSQLPPETQFILLELQEGGPYAVLLPLIDSGTWRATLRPPPRGAQEELHIRIESGDSSVRGSQWPGALLCAAGWEPFSLVEHAVAVAGSLSGGAKPRRLKQLPPSLNAFGWCTWDAFYSTVSARGLQEGLRALHRGGIRPGMLIIDDGWQCTDVDKALRDPSARKPPVLPGGPDNTAIDEFYDAELEMLRMGAKDIPGGSSLGVTLEALSADEDNMQHHYKSQPHRGKQELPWRKARTERRRSRQAQRQANANSLAPPPNTPAGSAFSAAASLDSRESYEVSRATVELSRDKLPEGQLDIGTLDFREAQLDATERVASAVLADKGLSVSERLRRADMLATTDSDLPTVIPEPNTSPGFIMWLIQAATQRLVGLFVGLFQALVLKFYQYVVDPAPGDSWPARFFAYLATGPFRQLLLEFFAASGDFTRRLTSVKANSKFSSPFAGPEDYFSGKAEALGDVVRALKSTFDLQYVYVWHGLSAYWSGVSVDDEGVAKYNARIIFAEPTPGLKEIEPSMAWNPSVVSGIGVPQSAAVLYNDMHHYLSHAGITGVKVDCQAGVGLMGSVLGGGPHAALEYHTALEDSVRVHFPGNHCINCMCHTTENLYRIRDTAVARASDDFYPRDNASSHPHVAACAFNSVFLAGLVQPDWDMFHSRHPAAMLHATARAVSGGAVYVSDYPGNHDFDLLHRLVLEDGTVLRALLPGRPTRDCLFLDVLRDNASLLKVWNINRHGGVVGVFHLQGSSWDRRRRQFLVHDKRPAPLKTVVRPKDIEGFGTGTPGQEVAAALKPSLTGGNGVAPAPPSAGRQFVASSSLSPDLQLLSLHDPVPVRLAGGESATVTIAPVVSHNGVQFAPIGLINMLNPGGAVMSVKYDSTVHRWYSSPPQRGSNRTGQSQNVSMTAHVEVKGAGSFVAYCSRLPLSCRIMDREVSFNYDEATGKLTVQLPRGGPIERLLTFIV